MIIVLVNYICREGCREEFLNAIKENGIDVLCRQEDGNIKYEYGYSVSDENTLILSEIWRDEEAVRTHGTMPHFARLSELKGQFVEKTVIERFEAKPYEL